MGDKVYTVGSLIADLAGQIRHALGVKGVAWASAAGLIGVLSCALSLVVVASSLDSHEVDTAQGEIAKFALADQSYRNFMRTVLGAGSGALPAPTGRLLVGEQWRTSNAELDGLCAHRHPSRPAPEQLSRLCASLPAIRQRIEPFLLAFDPPAMPLPIATVDELLGLGRQLNSLVAEGVLGTGALVKTMSHQFGWAIFVLTLTTAGFTGAGLVLIVLVGRASMLHYEQWQGAAAAAEQSTKLAQELQEQVARVEQGRLEYEALVDSLSDLVIKVDGETGNITFASAAAFELWGHAPSEIVGRRVFDFVAADDLERVMQEAPAALKAAKGIVQLQYRARTKSGEERHVEARFRRISGPDGKPVIVGLTRDVEERVRLERRLADEMARLRAIFESGGLVMALLDPDLRYVMVNQDFVDLVGLPLDRIIGHTPLEVLGRVYLDLEIIGRWRSGPPRLRPDDVMRYTPTIRDAQGRDREYATTVRPIVDEQGILRQILLLAIDDTQRRATERALFDAERLTTMGEMAGTMAHELAQPLQVISVANLSIQDELSEAAENGRLLDGEFLAARSSRIGDQVARASRIIGDVRAFVRGTSTDEASEIDPAAAVRGAVDLTAHAASQARMTVLPLLPARLPVVIGHMGRLEQVLVNLINNARDAGATAVEVVAAVQDSPERAVRIAVQDNGPGIAADVLPRLFETFITTKPRGLGTGLGLRICRRIVEEMGGRISAANRAEGGGACFEILLPAAQASNLAEGRR